MRKLKRFAGLAVCACAACILPASASAQAAAPRKAKWAIELYAGSTSVVGTQGGAAGTGFPAGATFTTVAGRPSRVVPSWFFGDGAVLLNDVLGQFATASGTTFARLSPLDAALQSGGSSQRGGVTFGARLSRDITNKLAIEISADRRVSGLAFNSGMTDSLNTTKDSFKSAFDGLLATLPATNLNVTSTLSTSEPSGSQMQFGAALNLRVAERGKLGVHLTAGGGVLTSGGESQATLTGTYTFRLLSTYTIAETDKAVVTIAPEKTAALGFGGGGLTWALSPRVALKADVRMSFVAARAATTVRGTPSAGSQSPTAAVPSLTTPSIQFSSQPGVTTTLSGLSSDITTFRASGWSRQVAATIAIVRRF